TLSAAKGSSRRTQRRRSRSPVLRVSFCTVRAPLKPARDRGCAATHITSVQGKGWRRPSRHRTGHPGPSPPGPVMKERYTMFMRKPAFPALALAAALAGTAGLSTLPALAQTAQPQAQDQAREHQGHHREFSAARHIDGRIAYLKAELKITPQQEPQFDRVAQAMRDNAAAKDQAMQK